MIIGVVIGLAFFILSYWAFAYILIYHLTRFGVGTLPKRIAGIFLLGSFVLFSVAMISLANVNLQHILSSTL